MAKKLSIITNGTNGDLPVQNQGLKLSKIIAIEKIEEHEKFKALYSIDENLLNRIADDMKANKFDASQPVHIWLVADDDGTEHFYLIDGYTRLKAAKIAGLLTVPYFEHHFDSFEEAHRYALHLQTDRRNLDGADLLRNIEELMGSDYIKNLPGNKNAAIGELLGKSEKTIERAKFVETNATEEQLADIESGEKSVNETFNEIKAERKKKADSKDSDRQMSVQDDEESETDTFDDISDALEDSSGNPHGLTITDHSDGIERPYKAPFEEDDTDRWIKEKNIQVEEARKEGFADGFYKALMFSLGEVLKGRTPKEIYKDERLNDLGKYVIPSFVLPEDDENAVLALEDE